jgi:hypothetical protein
METWNLTLCIRWSALLKEMIITIFITYFVITVLDFIVDIISVHTHTHPCYISIQRRLYWEADGTSALYWASGSLPCSQTHHWTRYWCSWWYLSLVLSRAVHYHAHKPITGRDTDAADGTSALYWAQRFITVLTNLSLDEILMQLMVPQPCFERSGSLPCSQTHHWTRYWCSWWYLSFVLSRAVHYHAHKPITGRYADAAECSLHSSHTILFL